MGAGNTNRQIMSETASNNKRIAKNTLLLYFRMLLTMAVSLYTSRVVLQTLGVADYGIYNVEDWGRFSNDILRKPLHVRLKSRLKGLIKSIVRKVRP